MPTPDDRHQRLKETAKSLPDPPMTVPLMQTPFERHARIDSSQLQKICDRLDRIEQQLSEMGDAFRKQEFEQLKSTFAKQFPGANHD